MIQWPPLPPVYETVFISAGQPWTSNHHDMQYLYLFTNIAMVVTTSEYGGVVLPQNQWTLFPYPDGQKVYAPTYPGGVYVIALSTNDEFGTDSSPRVGLNAYERSGQAYTASTGFLTVASANNVIGLGIYGQETQKHIHLSRILVATDSVTPCQVAVITPNTSGITAGFTVQPAIFNHAVNLAFQAPFFPTAKIFSTPSASTINTGAALGEPTAIISAGTIELLGITEKLIQKGTDGSVITYIQIPTTTNKAAITYDWFEEF